MNRLVLFPLALLLAPVLSAQNIFQRALNNDTMPNLVTNPGFEEVKKIPCTWTQDASKFNNDVMNGWNSPTETTPDLFSTRAHSDCWSNPAKRTQGKTSPHGGENMVGIKTWGKGNTPTFWHEYLQTTLPEPLKAGERYIVECWVQRANFSGEASNNIGMRLSALPVKTRDNLPLYFTPQVNADEILDAKGWRKVSGVIEANGDERYLMIGNFYSDETTLHKQQPQGERGAYYFIDDVNLRVAPPGTALTPRPKESMPPQPKVIVADHASTKDVELAMVEPPSVGKSIRLDNIGFEFAKATLTPESKKELDELADMLIDYPLMRIEVEGHTDDVGSDASNLTLSEDRAKAVVDFLRDRKVEKERIGWKGYGETKPLVPNDSEEHQALNRRVEFRVVEK
ncbi:MAG: OmpA family protein [Flavobacteriales bacterium]|nr:MAG: OmpA family protein [Flavobacteriales bacterium]